MHIRDLEALQHVPFLVWVKDEEWRYLWGNKAICDLAGENVVGKADGELVWKANAEALVKDDKQVLATGKPHFFHERVDHSEHGEATLSVCKWVDELDGRRLVFGISFVVPTDGSTLKRRLIGCSEAVQAEGDVAANVAAPGTNREPRDRLRRSVPTDRAQPTGPTSRRAATPR